MDDKTDIHFMNEAIIEAQRTQESSDIPVGAVLVHDGKIIGRGKNTRHSEKDPLGHAELIAIKEGAIKIGDWRLEDTTLYVTLEPCLMCIGAIINARVSRVVYGCQDIRFGALTLYGIDRDNKTNHKFEVTSGVLEDECKNLLQTFFKKLRKK
jgi:tRNA(adenine34) deaminase